MSKVEFKTVDGLTLRGRLYRAAIRGPAIILTPGFNLVKEVAILDIAEYLCAAGGFTTLAYDPRSTGESDGTPRSEIDPQRQVEDYHDAVTFLAALPHVDPKRIVLWGYSFSGTVALCAAALDKRAAAVVATAPLAAWEFSPPQRYRQVLRQAMRERESLVAGNTPVYLPVLTEDGRNPAGFGGGADELSEQPQVDAARDTMAVGERVVRPGYEQPTTLTTYYRLATFYPFRYMPLVPPTPVMVVIPDEDRLSPTEKQKSLIYDAISETGTRKRLLMVKGKGHMDVFGSEDFKRVLDAQIDFIRESLVGSV